MNIHCKKCEKKEIRAHGLCANCYNKRWSKKNASRALNYKFGGNRDMVLERDGYACRSCGCKDGLAVHHVDGKGTNLPIHQRNNDLNNLLTLCKGCHTRIHHKEGILGWQNPLGYWSPMYRLCACKNCGRNDKKHNSYGLCGTCSRRRRLGVSLSPLVRSYAKARPEKVSLVKH